MLALGVVSAFTLSWDVTIGLVIGCAIMAFDFYLMRVLLSQVLFGTRTSAGVSMALLVAKFLGLFGLVALCLFFIPMNLFAFGLGATAVVLTAAIVAMTMQKKAQEK